MARLPDKIPASQFNAALSFIQHFKAGLASSQTIRAELLHLLACLGRGETADTRAVLAGADAILRGHPDLAQRFDTFLGRPSQHEAKPVREDPVPVTAAPKRPKREHRRTVAECAGPMRFLERVKMADAGLYDMLLVLLFNVEMEGTLNAHQIYAKALEVFGSADSPLLRGFTQFLPLPTDGRDFLTRRRAKEEPEHGARASKRKAATAGKPPSAAKKPRADYDRKTTTSKSGRVSAFRDAWEFETTYSKLAVTLRRTEKSLEELKPRKESPEEVEPAPAPGHHGRPRTLEQLYPGRECQEVLQEMYGGMWGQMRVALEDGARTELALQTILRRLTKLEQMAVKMAMGRRDPARVEARVKLLVLERRDRACPPEGRMNKLSVD